MPSLNDARTSNATFAPPYTPVAVFVGATSGIGEAMAKALTSYLGGKLHLFIVGRNQAAAEKTFASLPRPEGVKREFVYCDAFLMRNIVAASEELKKLVPGGKINFLVLSLGYFRFAGRDETEEGLDKVLVMRYYSRFKFISELLPLLQVAKETGEDAKVMTMLAAGMSASVDREDLGMRKKYRIWNAGLKPITYNDVMIEEYAKRNPGIGFTHINPGTVNTPGASQVYESLWGPMKLLGLLLWLRYWFYGIQSEECAEYMLYALLDRLKENGWSRRDDHGDDIGMRGYNISAEDKRAVWEHSLAETSV